MIYAGKLFCYDILQKQAAIVLEQGDCFTISNNYRSLIELLMIESSLLLNISLVAYPSLSLRLIGSEYSGKESLSPSVRRLSVMSVTSLQAQERMIERHCFFIVFCFYCRMVTFPSDNFSVLIKKKIFHN